MKLFCRYLVGQMEKRDGFHLLWKVRQCFRHSADEPIFLLQEFPSLILDFSHAAGLCECMLLVHTTKYEGEGGNCRLLGKAGKSKFQSVKYDVSVTLLSVAQTHKFYKLDKGLQYKPKLTLGTLNFKLISACLLVCLFVCVC